MKIHDDPAKYAGRTHESAKPSFYMIGQTADEQNFLGRFEGEPIVCEKQTINGREVYAFTPAPANATTPKADAPAAPTADKPADDGKATKRTDK